MEQIRNPLVVRPDEDRSWWNHPWVIALGSGLVLLVAGLFLSDVPRKSLAVGIGVLVVLSALTWGAVRGRTAYQQFRTWETAVSRKVLWLHDQLQWHVLSEVIHEAQAHGWDVGSLGDAQGIGMTAPDGTRVHVEPDLMSDHALAERLHVASPDHFRGARRSCVNLSSIRAISADLRSV